MHNNDKLQPTIGVRIVAVLMMVGGIVGVIGAIRLVLYWAARDESLPFVVHCCSIPLFAWTAFVGWNLWRGQTRFLRWAAILFGLQVIVFGVGGFAYEFSTGLSARIAVGGFMVPMPPPSHNLSIGANFGSSLNLNLTRDDSRWMVGINVVALIIWLYVLRSLNKPHAFGGGSLPAE